jgi:hypothetical protein
MPFSEGGQSVRLPLCYRLLKDMGGVLSFSQENNDVVFMVSLDKTIQPRLRERKAESVWNSAFPAGKKC